MSDELQQYLGELRQHLRDELLPFWASHGADEKCGGFLTYFDRNGRPTGETTKTFLCQTRMIYSYSAAHRVGYGEGCFLDFARQGVDFITRHFWDDAHGGWFWTTKRDGTPLNTAKLTYGHAFAIYALSEYAMASGDSSALDWAERTFSALQANAADNRYGGYYEFLERDWSVRPSGKTGGDRKSFDVHMHLMEAFTNLAEATGSPLHTRRAGEMIGLIEQRILHPEFRTGVAQFLLDWSPVPQILFNDVWGADRDVEDGGARPQNNTSFGHNVEFAWLLLHACRTLGLSTSPHEAALRRIFDHCTEFGVDWERGGVYCEGPHNGPARERNKEFWQQAECMTGMLDAYALFGDGKYLEAYANVHRFVMDHVINHEVGEWFPLLDERNNVVWGYIGSAWKINYHTIRAMLNCEARLERLVGG